MKKEEAKKRAEKFRAFRKGLEDFEQDGVYDRDEQNRDRLDSYHRRMEEELVRLEEAETLAAARRFRRRMRLLLLSVLLVGAGLAWWSVRSGHFSPGPYWSTLLTRAEVFMRGLLLP
ncbi:MAG: hypothetical protein R2940_10375 [Syntrophotaleaceae bacterium]